MRMLMTNSIAAIALTASPALAQDTTTTDAMTPPAATDTMPAPQTDPMPTPDTTMPDAKPPVQDPVTDPMADPMAQPIPTEPATDPSGPTTEDGIDGMADDAAPDVDTYRTGLTPERQELFDRIAPDDQATLAGLDSAQQEQAWASIEEQAAAQQATTEPEAE